MNNCNEKCSSFDKGIMGIRNFCIQEFPFISDDFDSMTTYELLSKVICYLKSIGKFSDELGEKFNQLLDYVNGYFDNLDITVEINNILERMYDEGILTDMVSEVITEGTLGNKGFDPNVSPVAYSDKFLHYDNSFINVKKDSETRTPNDCPSPIMIIQKELNYIDDNPVADENFQCAGGIYSELDISGYSLNQREATTQNFANIYAVSKSGQGGIVGSTCIQGKNYIVDSPEVQSVGGNKSGALGGLVFNMQPYERGGYALGCEIDMFTTHNSGTSPVYRANDYNVYTRTTACLYLVGYGNTEPVTHGLALQRAGVNTNGMWNGITFGSSMHLIKEGDEMKAGVFGTTGLNFASWRPYTEPNNGGYGYSCMRTNWAVRHIDAVQPFKINANSLSLYNRSDEVTSCVFNICAGQNAFPAITFNTCDEGVGSAENTVMDPVKNQHGFIKYEKNALAMQYVADNCSHQFLQRIDGNLSGLVLQSTALRPTANHNPSLGDPTHRFNNLYIDGGINIDGVVLDKAKLLALLNLIQ